MAGNKLRIAVLGGGPSSEHEVSLSSARSMVENLSNEKYVVNFVEISKKNKWRISDDKVLDMLEALDELKKTTDVFLIGLHGTFGEDGALQALLEMNGIKYTGSSAASSFVAFDKELTGHIYKHNKLPHPNFEVFDNAQDAKKFTPEKFPIVVKPLKQGSSVGVSIVKEPDNYKKAVEIAFEHDKKIMVQEFVPGREVSCGVLQKGNRLLVLPPTELIPKNADFFDYKAKYNAGQTDEITPPDMPEETIKLIQDYALKSHDVLGCGEYSRTDMIVTDDEIYLIETNTLPGMTPTSILPQEANSEGISFSELLDFIIEAA